MISNSTVVMIHSLWPSLIKEKKDYIEKWRDKSFEVIDVRHLFFTSWHLLKANFICKKKLSKLFEHYYKTKNKNNEEFDLVQSLKKYIDDIFLVSEDVFMDIEKIYYSNDLDGLENDTVFSSTIDNVLVW